MCHAKLCHNIKHAYKYRHALVIEHTTSLLYEVSINRSSVLGRDLDYIINARAKLLIDNIYLITVTRSLRSIYSLGNHTYTAFVQMHGPINVISKIYHGILQQHVDLHSCIE